GGQTLLPREAVEIGPTQTVPKDAGDREVAFRPVTHAGAVLRPFVCDERLGRHHAQIARDLATGERSSYGAPLRPVAARSLGPQSVDHESEPARSARALPPIIGTRLAPTTIFRRPAQRERIAMDRLLPYGSVAVDFRDAYRGLRDAALIG